MTTSASDAKLYKAQNKSIAELIKKVGEDRSSIQKKLTVVDNDIHRRFLKMTERFEKQISDEWVLMESRTVEDRAKFVEEQSFIYARLQEGLWVW
jgi:hypothetical protein